MIRDQDTIYVFMDQQADKPKRKANNLMKKISDPFQYFKELTGPMTVISCGLNKVCCKNGVLPVCEDEKNKVINTFIYQSEGFKE